MPDGFVRHGMQEVRGSSPLSSTMTWSDVMRRGNGGQGCPSTPAVAWGLNASLSLAPGPGLKGALNRLWPPLLPVTLGVPAAADVSRRSGCCEGWRGDTFLAVALVDRC